MKKRLSIKTEITQDRVLQEFARIAFLDPRKLLDMMTGRPIADARNSMTTRRAAIAGLKDIRQIHASDMKIAVRLIYRQ
jgi:hypothetical protein